MSWKWQKRNTFSAVLFSFSRWRCEAERAGPRNAALPSCLHFSEIAQKRKPRGVTKVRSHPCLSLPVLADWKRKQTANASITSHQYLRDQNSCLTSTALIARVDRKINLEKVEAIIEQKKRNTNCELKLFLCLNVHLISICYCCLFIGIPIVPVFL